MSLGIALVCRYNSSRLEGKILKKIHERSVLEIIVERLQFSLPNIPVVIATSIEKSDDIICEYCEEKGYAFFRGSLNDVGSRLIHCAKSYNWNHFVRINGDNVFVDTESLKEMIRINRDMNEDFVTNVPSRTFPYGMSVEILKTSFYEKIYSSNSFSKSDKEHVTKWLYKNLTPDQYYEFKNKSYENLEGKRLALDTEEDFALINEIINNAEKSIINIDLKDLSNFFKEK